MCNTKHQNYKSAYKRTIYKGYNICGLIYQVRASDIAYDQSSFHKVPESTHLYPSSRCKQDVKSIRTITNKLRVNQLGFQCC